MSEQTREEVDAKLAAVEARMDARLVGIEGKIDRIGDQIQSAVKLLSAEVSSARAASERAEESAEAARSVAGSMRWNILFTALGVLAVMAAGFALWMQAVDLAKTLATHWIS